MCSSPVFFVFLKQKNGNWYRFFGKNHYICSIFYTNDIFTKTFKNMNKIDQTLKKYLKAVDSGKIFSKPIKPIYLIIGWLHLLLPLLLIKVAYDTYNNDYYRSGFKQLRYTFGDHDVIIGFVLVALFAVACLAAYCAIKFWTDRAKRLDVLIKPSNEFCVLPIIVTFTRNFGEGMALVMVIWGIGISVIVGLGLLCAAFVESDYFKEIFKASMSVLFGGTILTIVSSYLTLVLHRYLSELMGLLVSIASNVSRIAHK